MEPRAGPGQGSRTEESCWAPRPQPGLPRPRGPGPSHLPPRAEPGDPTLLRSFPSFPPGSPDLLSRPGCPGRTTGLAPSRGPGRWARRRESRPGSRPRLPHASRSGRTRGSADPSSWGARPTVPSPGRPFLPPCVSAAGQTPLGLRRSPGASLNAIKPNGERTASCLNGCSPPTMWRQAPLSSPQLPLSGCQGGWAPGARLSHPFHGSGRELGFTTARPPPAFPSYFWRVMSVFHSQQ